MFRYKIIIEYFGKYLGGWQRQDNTLSVQEIIESAIKTFSKCDTTLIVAGRTDAGVNAYGQVAHFDLPINYNAYKMVASINHFTRPFNVAILKCDIVPSTFDARYSAVMRHYVYKIVNRAQTSVIESQLRTWIAYKLDVDNMEKASNYLVGEYDFSSFRASGCQAASPITTINEIKFVVDGDKIDIYFSGRSFLYRMVRSMVGSLIMVGKGEWQPEYMEQVLNARDRRIAGPTAPAAGLFFLRVDY